MKTGTYVVHDVAPEEDEDHVFTSHGPPVACIRDFTYVPGDRVLAVFPDTTTFYGASVVGRTPNRNEYKVMFDGEVSTLCVQSRHMMPER